MTPLAEALKKTVEYFDRLLREPGKAGIDRPKRREDPAER
jgi:hypothetical protein